VLELVERPDPLPGSGQVLIDVGRCGVNFADLHQSSGSYVAQAQLPLVPGAEVAGRLRGDGRRVVALTGTGGYAELAVADADRVFDVPDAVSDEQALALVIQGTTAWHLCRTAAHLEPGETVVVHSAAGGVGALAVQLARRFGAGRIVATASGEERRALALELGADVAVDGAPEGLTERLLDAAQGPPDVVFDMAGGAVFDASYAALAPFGRIVVCGIASREKNSVSTGSLLRHSRSVVGFYLFHTLERPGLFTQALDELFAMVAQGELRVHVGATYPLSQAARAHEELRERRTSGKLVLDPAI